MALEALDVRLVVTAMSEAPLDKVLLLPFDLGNSPVFKALFADIPVENLYFSVVNYKVFHCTLLADDPDKCELENALFARCCSHQALNKRTNSFPKQRLSSLQIMRSWCTVVSSRLYGCPHLLLTGL